MTIFGPKYKGARITPGKRVSPIVTAPYVRGGATAAPGPAKFVPHDGTAKPAPVYTGDKLLGIGVRHKSGLEPVFSAEQASDLAKMRRG